MGYKPVVTSGLQLLLDASTLALANGASVTAWADQSGQGNNASIPSGLSSPLFESTAFNGKPCVRFGGGTQGMGGTFSGWTGAAGFTIITASSNYAQSGVPNNCGYLSLAQSGGTDFTDAGGYTFTGDGNSANFSSLYFYRNSAILIGTVADVSHGTMRAPTNPIVIANTAVANSSSLYLNGGTYETLAISTSLGNPGLYALGQRYQSGAYSTTSGGKFDLAILSIYNRALSASEAQRESLAMGVYLGILSSGLFGVAFDGGMG